MRHRTALCPFRLTNRHLQPYDFWAETSSSPTKVSEQQEFSLEGDAGVKSSLPIRPSVETAFEKTRND